MSIEAMKQALEALYKNEDFLFDYHECEPNNEREVDLYSECHAKNKSAITSLRQAIAEAQKQEPVGEVLLSCGDYKEISWKGGKLPPVGAKLYTSPPQRQPLTDEQKDSARYRHVKGMARAMSLDINGDHYWTVALHGIRGPSLDEAIDRAIEAAHGIKGEA